jgi:tRNA pseudouridine38-40 synthase
MRFFRRCLDDVMRNLKITLAYDGSEFSGWQVQPDRPTIQGTLASAIERITGERVLPQGSGRTDAGVHALAQVASCPLQSPIPETNLAIALNDILPAAIRVTAVDEVPADFHARKSAKGKTYRYLIYRADVCPPFLARYVYHHPYPLDEPAMTAAAAQLIGEYDFTSFAAVDPERGKEETSNIRTISDSQFRREGDQLLYEVSGSGFLHHMVRNLIGTFLLVGKKTLKPADLRDILQARNRSANPGATAPASGLYLVSVEY